MLFDALALAAALWPVIRWTKALPNAASLTQN
jgi:hypothetical protein